MSFVATTICFSQERFDWPASRTQLIAKAASTLWLARLQSCQQDAVVPEAPCCQEFASAEAVTCSHPPILAGGLAALQARVGLPIWETSVPVELLRPALLRGT